VLNTSAIKAWGVAVGSFLWWPDYSLLWWWSRGTVELLLVLLVQLELPLLVLQATAPILLLLRSAQLTPGWGIHHAVLRRCIARTTTTRVSTHHPLTLLLIGLSNGLHQPLLINGGTQQVIVGQVGELT
jgi:hypothetical protein